MVYLFIGEDNSSKDIQLKRLKQEFLKPSLEQFNFDRLYAKETTLKDLQEKILFLPVKNPQRIIIIKEAQDLREEVRDFVLKYAGLPDKRIILILDVPRYDRKNDFINRLTRLARTLRFKETPQPDAFTLERQINFRKLDLALRMLHQLLQKGERPERILGALRYAWEREGVSSALMKRRLKLMLNCDIDIKTGRLKPVLALEKLVISLCSLAKPAH